MRAGFQILGFLVCFVMLIWSVVHVNLWACVAWAFWAAWCLVFLVTDGLESGSDAEDFY